MPHEHDLLEYATKRLGEIAGLRIVGTAKHKASVISFVFENPPLSTLDVGMALDRVGICVRTGHHCCQPLMDRYGIGSTVRASFSMYNTRAEVDALVKALKEIRSNAAPTKSSAQTEIVFPKAAGRSPDAVSDELAELFEFLGDSAARNQQLLDFGNDLPPYFEQLKKLAPR
jgi:cysteine desulfurase/selenocysteine lyase